MNFTILTCAFLGLSMFPLNGHAFDLGGLVKGAITDAVTEVVEDTAKDVTKTAVKEAAGAAGVDGADQYIDMAVDNADGIQNTASGLSATTGMMNSGGVAAASGALSSAAIAADAAKKISSGEGDTPGDKFRNDYHRISTKMGNCGSDTKCITKYQQQLIDLQKRGDSYVSSTGDVNFNGKQDEGDQDLTLGGSIKDIIKSGKPAGSYN